MSDVGAMASTGDAIRAVVLDLDDTLFDTSGTLLEPANRDAAAAMIGAGLPGTVESVAQRRLQFGRSHPGDDADALTARSFGLENRPEIAAAGRMAFYNRTVRSIQPFPDTIPVLTDLSQRFDLFLLTVGAPRTQQRKIELLGIEEYFAEVVLVDIVMDTKYEALASLAGRHGLEHERIVVVGDRIDREIDAGRRLGMWTVRMAHGEGKHLRPSGPSQQAHYTIERLDGLPHVLADIVASGESPGEAMAAVEPV
jgi:FMN phosphatase YigB (HAD superfamily)